MHIINLAVKCKIATGDGTKIVCMNSDYRVRVEATDCGTFTNAPIKKLVVRQDKEYSEISLTEVNVDGQIFYEAALPSLERNNYVDLGVCGKSSDDPDVVPVYTSTAARFECDQSVLSGVVIRKDEPTLSKLDVTENGTYRASDYGADGFYEANVQVPRKVEETRTVPLSMTTGNQMVLPSYDTRTMSGVVIEKPASLVPENIRNGVDIGGVTGSYEGSDYILDGKICYTVDSTLRTVIVPDDMNVIGVVGDNNAIIVYFEMPRMIGIRDISTCDQKFVSWEAADGTVGHDTLTIDEASDTIIYFAWSIREGLTSTAGPIAFSLHFEDDANSSDYRWSTSRCNSCQIVETNNAPLGAYEAIYVADDMLVLSDYAPIHDKTLQLETDGLIPTGTLEINAAGIHDVGEYAAVKVVELFETPTISVDGDSGRVEVEANGKVAEAELKSFDDDLIPENIREGVRIFGVDGIFGGDLDAGVITIRNTISSPMAVTYSNYDNGTSDILTKHIEPGSSTEIRCVNHSLVRFWYSGPYDFVLSGEYYIGGTGVTEISRGNYEILVKVDNPVAISIAKSVG